MAVNSKSLKNLIPPPKKGEVRNPLGGKTHDKTRKELKRLTGPLLAEIVELILNSGEDGLRKVMKDDSATALKKCAASATLRAMKSGDWSFVDPLIIRALGKPKETISIEGSAHALLVKMIHENSKDEEE